MLLLILFLSLRKISDLYKKMLLKGIKQHIYIYKRFVFNFFSARTYKIIPLLFPEVRIRVILGDLNPNL